MSMDQQPLSKRPNVIRVFGDQHRAQALGCSGDVNVHTPNIDNLAAIKNGASK
jgi:arylsulfatase A-like enzyme